MKEEHEVYFDDWAGVVLFEVPQVTVLWLMKIVDMVKEHKLVCIEIWADELVRGMEDWATQKPKPMHAPTLKVSDACFELCWRGTKHSTEDCTLILDVNVPDEYRKWKRKKGKN